MKEKWLVSFGITHIVSLSFVLTFSVKNALLFYSDINVIVGIKSVYIIAPYNSSPDRLFSIVIFLKSLDNETFAKEISSYIGVK